MHRVALLAAAVGGAASLALAQGQLVSPAALENSYGGINNSIPWGPFGTGEWFVQQIDDELRGTPRVLKGMAFRHQYTATHALRTYTVVVKVGDAATAAAGMSTTFANNWKTGGSMTTVVNGPVSFPAVSPYPRPPAPFDAPVMFTAPHVHTGTDSAMWEVHISAASATSPTHFFERGPGTTHTAGVIGTGCTVTGATNPMTSSGTITKGTTPTFTDRLVNGPASASVLLVIGDTSPTVGSMPLPIDLTVIGSPGCWLNINPLFSIGQTTDASGNATLTARYRWGVGTSGERLRTQWAALDGGVLRTSNGLDHSVPYDTVTGTAGKPWPQNRVWANGFSGTPPATGSLQNNGLVTQWML